MMGSAAIRPMLTVAKIGAAVSALAGGSSAATAGTGGAVAPATSTGGTAAPPGDVPPELGATTGGAPLPSAPPTTAVGVAVDLGERGLAGPGFGIEIGAEVGVADGTGVLVAVGIDVGVA